MNQNHQKMEKGKKNVRYSKGKRADARHRRLIAGEDAVPGKGSLHGQQPVLAGETIQARRKSNGNVPPPGMDHRGSGSGLIHSLSGMLIAVTA